ncbi:RICIN domain-containing protein [Actinoplanes sp. Pm04-4]|uniref:RICIN domain-containing protein n=1 Tax=Paractinoplanes pyxinae TaxID=2997416 RepID=A0ABT4B3K6_9ACTN|nr:RICIN domain-containing protein [Actinoplanes pyxinae]MCY1141078.1 RICIN domain-containing protein [Actinoplanes pyxinae]
MLRRALVSLLAVLVFLPTAQAQAAPAVIAAPAVLAAPAAPAALGEVVVPAVAGPVDLVGLDFQVINAGSKWCLTSELTELPCARSDPYKWRFRPVDVTGQVELLSVKTGRCLGMPGGTRQAGARAGLEPCGAVQSRRWQLRDSVGETAKVVNSLTGQCLQIASGVAVQDSCAGTGGARRWTVRVLSMPIPGLM